MTPLCKELNPNCLLINCCHEPCEVIKEKIADSLYQFSKSYRDCMQYIEDNKRCPLCQHNEIRFDIYPTTVYHLNKKVGSGYYLTICEFCKFDFIIKKNSISAYYLTDISKTGQTLKTIVTTWDQLLKTLNLFKDKKGVN